MKNLITRAITGILFIGIIISAIFYSQYTFLVLLLVITTLALTEFYGLVEKEDSRKLVLFVNLFGGNYLTFALYSYASGILPDSLEGKVFLPYLIYFLCCFIIQLYAKDKNPIIRWAHSLMGQLYIALPIGLLSFLAFTPNLSGYNPWLLCSFFMFIWINDTGAFLVGSAIGKKRLFERISPKKSWEGFCGGIVFNLILAYILSTQFDFLTPFEWYGLAITISIFATFGDLCESLLKRTLQIKDSGSILPGHGGMLDRFDSVLLAAPAAVVYLFLCS